jgi:hypothetical protein
MIIAYRDIRYFNATKGFNGINIAYRDIQSLLSG